MPELEQMSAKSEKKQAPTQVGEDDRKPRPNPQKYLTPAYRYHCPSHRPSAQRPGRRQDDLAFVPTGIRIPIVTHVRLTKLAASYGVTRSSLIRMVLAKYLPETEKLLKTLAIPKKKITKTKGKNYDAASRRIANRVKNQTLKKKIRIPKKKS